MAALIFCYYFIFSLSIVHCPPGTHGGINGTSSACFPCQVATYQPDQGQTSCIPCPTGSNSLRTGLETLSSCKGEAKKYYYITCLVPRHRTSAGKLIARGVVGSKCSASVRQFDAYRTRIKRNVRGRRRYETASIQDLQKLCTYDFVYYTRRRSIVIVVRFLTQRKIVEH